MTCFFIGHRDAPASLYSILYEAVERHITEYGVTDFTVGHYGSFDRLAARAVKDAKKRHPAVTLTLLLPYYPYDGPSEWLGGFDGTFYPPGLETVPKQVAIVQANEYMIKNSDYLIAYDRGAVGKTRGFLALARQVEKKGLIHVENLHTSCLAREHLALWASSEGKRHLPQVLAAMTTEEVIGELEALLEQVTEETYDGALLNVYLQVLEEKAPSPAPDMEGSLQEFLKKAAESGLM